MILRLSETLSRKIRVTPTVKRPLNANPFADFSCHAVSVNGHDYILAANTASFYGVVFSGDSIDRSTAFESELYERLQGHIVRDGFEFLYKRLINSDGDTISYTCPLNDVITASLEQLARKVVSQVKQRRVSTDEVTETLNGSPLPLIRHERPRDRFRTLTFQG